MSEVKEPEWIRIQSKTFRNWCNTHLKHRMLSINDLRTDLANGIMLINLVEIISSKQVNNGKYQKNPRMRTQMFENNGLALQFLQKEGLKLVNIGNEDIVDGNHKLILGLIWTIILRYQINITEGKSARTELLNWVRRKLPERTINNFDHDWNDGTILCGLIDALNSSIPNWRELDPSKAMDNATLGLNTAEKEMGIEQLIAPEDLTNPEVDELSMMTYIALFKTWEDNQAALKDTIDAAKTAISGPGVEGGKDVVVRKAAPFKITAKNAFNDPLTKGGATFKVTVTGPNNTNVPATITDNGDGTYDGSYTPTAPGAHVVKVETLFKDVAQSPYNVEIDAGVDASKSTVSGPAVEPHGAALNRPAQGTIEARDSDGNKVSAGGAPFVVSVQGPKSAVESPVSDNGDGTYGFTYTPTELGQHTVNVQLEDKKVAESPYSVSVHELVDPSKTRVSGPGINPSVPEGVPTYVEIQAVGDKGDDIKTGGAKFDVQLETPNGKKETIPVKDNGDGTYRAEYTPTENGKNVVHVENVGPAGAQPVAKSPYPIEVRDAADKSKSLVSGPGIRKGVPMGPTNVKVEARDKNGNPVGKGGDHVTVDVNGPSGPVPVELKDNGDGTYDATYEPTELGPHDVEVKLAGDHVAESPYHVTVRDPADPEKSEVSGPGIRKGVPMGIPTHLVVQAKDKDGNPVPNGNDDVHVTVDGPNGPVDVQLEDKDDGTYVAAYTPTDLGKHTVNVTIGDKHVADSPYHVTSRPPADNSKTEVSGPGIKSGIPNGVPTWVDIKAKDANGEPVTSGNDNFQVEVKGPNGTVPVQLEDNDDGTYKAHYTPTDLGDHVVEVKLQDEHVADSPYNVLSRPAADKSLTEVTGPGVKDGVPEQVETFFDISAKDAEGKDVEHGGDRFQVEVTGPKDVQVEATVKDNEDGTYHVTYTAPCIGPFKVKVSLQDEDVADSTYKLKVRERGDASKTTADGPGLVHPTQNVPQHFKVTCRDRDGNDLAYGGDKLTVNITGPEGVQVEAQVEDKYDGKYRVDYTPLVVGDHVIEILLNGEHIAKSPYQVYVDEEADEDESGLESFSFGIVARRKNGEQKPRGGDQFRVKIDKKDSDEEIDDINIKDRGDGRYRVMYKLPGEGEYLINITLNGKHIKGSPWKQNL